MSLKPRQTHKIIVVQRPGLWWLSGLLLLALLAGICWLSFDYGRHHVLSQSDETRSYVADLENQLATLQRENIASRRQATMLERSRQIDLDAANQLKQTLLEAQNEVLSLKKQLKLYKSVVSPEAGQRSLHIKSVMIEPSRDKPQEYRYKFMLNQSGRNDRTVRGTLVVSIKGKKNGKAVKLKLSDLSAQMKKTTKFGFKYFQTFEGSMRLPEAFIPESVAIVVKPSIAKIKPLDEQFSWKEVLSGGA